MEQQAEAEVLKKELYGLFKYLQRVREEIGRIEVKPEKEKTEDEELLQGPALEGEGITQAEIDKLFD